MQQVDTLNNPIVEQRADPWVYKHTDGYYYFTASVPEYDRLEVRRATTIQGLGEAEPVVAWRKREESPMSANIWAPEIHYIDGKWYIYYAAARADEIFDHRMYVIENESANPLEGNWVEKGQVKTDWESFSLDATTFEHKGQRYYVWAQRDPEIVGNSNLYIDSDLLDPASWHKFESPVFQTNEENSQYGPGHNSFTVSEDGSQDTLIYHARNYRDIEGDPLWDPNRHTRAQVFTWNEDGTPNFGVPVADAK